MSLSKALERAIARSMGSSMVEHVNKKADAKIAKKKAAARTKRSAPKVKARGKPSKRKSS